MVDAIDIINDVRQLLKGEPVFLAGSLVAEHVHGLTDAHSDVDLFCPTSNQLIASGQKLLDNGFVFGDRFERVWQRWLTYGMKNWHTNSVKLFSPGGVEYNLVYKTTEGHAATSLAEVLESFDFGLLGAGYDLRDGRLRDMRRFLFPGHASGLGTGTFANPALPMMPSKRANWRMGYISQYNGMREFGRYAKYAGYGYDMSLVKDDLVEGYRMAALYMSNHFDAEKQQLGLIYEATADHIEQDNIDHLLEASKKIEYKDALDAIMEALE